MHRLTTRSSEQRLALGSFSWLTLSPPASIAELGGVRRLRCSCTHIPHALFRKFCLSLRPLWSLARWSATSWPLPFFSIHASPPWTMPPTSAPPKPWRAALGRAMPFWYALTLLLSGAVRLRCPARRCLPGHGLALAAAGLFAAMIRLHRAPARAHQQPGGPLAAGVLARQLAGVTPTLGHAPRGSRQRAAGGVGFCWSRLVCFHLEEDGPLTSPTMVA